MEDSFNFGVDSFDETPPLLSIGSSLEAPPATENYDQEQSSLQEQQPQRSTNVLSQDEFNNLIKTVQLLRISQLRYIVQKYSIPASGNKTKLLGLVIQVFHNMKNDPVLVEIMHDINELLAQQDAPFATPAFSSGTLELAEENSDYVAPFNPTIAIDPSVKVFGPLLAKPGRSTGKFEFTTPANESGPQPTAVAFLFYGGNPQPISLLFEVNGIPFEVFKDDSTPSPIDITNVISPPGSNNTIDIKSLNTAVPFMIQIIQYEYIGLRACIQQLCGGVDITKETPLVKTKTCTHENPFSLIDYMSDALATGKWICPICGSDAQTQNLIVVDSVSTPQSPLQSIHIPEHDQPDAPIVPEFAPDSIFTQTPDIYSCSSLDHFDWDTF